MPSVQHAETRQTDVPKEPLLSIKEVAHRASITEHAVRKALREGRLRRSNPASERAMFSAKEVERFIEERAERAAQVMRPKTLAIVRKPSEQMQLAKVDAMTEFVAQSQQHTEHAWDQTRMMVDAVRKSLELVNESKDRIIELQQARIEKLEVLADDYRKAMDAIRENQFNQTIADAEAQVVKERGRALIELAKMAGPAVLFRVFGGDKLAQGAFGKFVESLSDDQRDKIFGVAGEVLKPDQVGVLMALLSGFDKPANTNHTNGAAGDTERPPPPEEHAS